jgi:hypothetical protein
MHTNMLSSLAVCGRGKDWVTTTEKRILEKCKINSSQSIPPEGFYKSILGPNRTSKPVLRSIEINTSNAKLKVGMKMILAVVAIF